MTPQARKRKSEGSVGTSRFFDGPERKQGKKRQSEYLEEYAFDEARQSHKNFLAVASGPRGRGRRSGLELIESEIKANMDNVIEFIKLSETDDEGPHEEPELGDLMNEIKSIIQPTILRGSARDICPSVTATTVIDYIDRASTDIKEYQHTIEKDLVVKSTQPTRWDQDSKDLFLLNQKAVEQASLLLNAQVDPTGAIPRRALRGNDGIERMALEWFEEAIPTDAMFTWGFAARKMAASFDWHWKLMRDASSRGMRD